MAKENKKLTQQMTIIIPYEWYEKLSKLAQEKSRYMAGLVKDAIKEYLEKEEGKVITDNPSRHPE